VPFYLYGFERVVFVRIDVSIYVPSYPLNALLLVSFEIREIDSRSGQHGLQGCHASVYYSLENFCNYILIK
jgi:hypothetical protein